MIRGEEQKADMKLPSKGFNIPLQDPKYLSSCLMDVRPAAKRHISTVPPNYSTELGKRSIEYKRSFSQGHAKSRIFSASYFSVESMLLLVCLTASLLLLPLVLPPLPPPPFMLLLLPICIFALLMFLAFMPTSNVRDATYTYL